jgi:hypothetical protein
MEELIQLVKTAAALVESLRVRLASVTERGEKVILDTRALETRVSIVDAREADLTAREAAIKDIEDAVLYRKESEKILADAQKFAEASRTECERIKSEIASKSKQLDASISIYNMRTADAEKLAAQYVKEAAQLAADRASYKAELKAAFMDGITKNLKV